jgi:hypothetical protein
MFCPSRLFRAADTTGLRTATPRDVPGSRLLPTHRAARLQSGSPPERSLRSTRGLFATLLLFVSHPSSALTFLSYCPRLAVLGRKMVAVLTGLRQGGLTISPGSLTRSIFVDRRVPSPCSTFTEDRKPRSTVRDTVRLPLTLSRLSY